MYIVTLKHQSFLSAKTQVQLNFLFMSYVVNGVSDLM